MRRLVLVPLLGSLLLAGSGCGTVLNFFDGESGGPRRVYGGVQIDCEVAAEQLKDQPVQGIPLVHQPAQSIPMILLALFDLPLSAFGDTLTLPLVLSARWHELTDDRPPVLAPAWTPR
jgi:uncharacterized protein YceK